MAEFYVNLGLLFVALGGFIAIFVQLWIQGRRDRRWNTLDACHRYDTDPILHETTKFLALEAGPDDDYTRFTRERHEHATVTMLNFLDAVAISVKQGIYAETIIKAHFEHIIPKAVRGLILGIPDPSDPQAFTPTRFLEEEYFECLIWLHYRWYPDDRGPARAARAAADSAKVQAAAALAPAPTAPESRIDPAG